MDNWYQSQDHKFIFNRTIDEKEIIVGDINYPVVELHEQSHNQIVLGCYALK